MAEICRLYLVSPPEIGDPSRFAEAFEAALDAGDVAAFQLRLKDSYGTPAPDDEILRLADRLLPIARARDVAFLINDRPDLAKRIGADGVHVGQSDVSCKEARSILGDGAIIGVTCHNSRHLALVASEAGADYVAFGAFFPTATKEAPTRADPEILSWWRYATTLPSVAIGGITPENCGTLVAAGADYVAAASAVWADEAGAPAAVKAFNAAIARAANAR